MIEQIDNQSFNSYSCIFPSDSYLILIFYKFYFFELVLYSGFPPYSIYVYITWLAGCLYVGYTCHCNPISSLFSVGLEEGSAFLFDIDGRGAGTLASRFPLGSVNSMAKGMCYYMFNHTICILTQLQCQHHTICILTQLWHLH